MTYSDAAQTYARQYTEDWWTAQPFWHDKFAAAFDAGHAAALATVAPVQPRVLTTAAELAEYQGTDAVFRDSSGQVWSWFDSAWMMRGDDERFTALYVTHKHRLPLTLLAPVPATAEPVRLTADDPRWRDGAKVRGEWSDGSACEGWLYSMPILPGKWFIKHGGIGRSVDVDQVTVYLIAEAPNPDADKRLVLRQALADARLHDWSDAELDDILHGLDGRNYDLTWRGES